MPRLYFNTVVVFPMFFWCLIYFRSMFWGKNVSIIKLPSKPARSQPPNMVRVKNVANKTLMVLLITVISKIGKCIYQFLYHNQKKLHIKLWILESFVYTWNAWGRRYKKNNDNQFMKDLNTPPLSIIHIQKVLCIFRK